MCKIRSNEWQEILKIYGELDRIIIGITTRTMNLSEGIVAYVLALLSTRSFRLATGAVYLATSGYPDLVPNLNRTSWEIGLRILAMKEDPVAASYGYLLHGASTEIKVIEVEIEHREKFGEEPGFMHKNLKSLKLYRKMLEELCIAQNRDPLTALNKFGRLNVRQVCKRLGIEKAYSVTFSWDSGFVHGNNITSDQFVYDHGPDVHFDLGPLLDSPDAGIIDALRQCSFVLFWSADIIDDQELASSARSCVDQLHSWGREIP